MVVAKCFKKIFLIGILIILVNLCTIGFIQAQTWTALPPYNFLWPLWSPALSPVDATTGLQIPIVSALYPNTVLPFQPGIAWNPIYDYPYFLYNSPVGLQYYDQVYGFGGWPPSYVIDPATGAGLSLTLPAGYQYLAPTDSQWIINNTPVANTAYLSEYPLWASIAFNAALPPYVTGVNPLYASLVLPTPYFSSLLTPAQILGYTPVSVTPPPVGIPITFTNTTTTTAYNPAAALLALGILGLY